MACMFHKNRSQIRIASLDLLLSELYKFEEKLSGLSSNEWPLLEGIAVGGWTDEQKRRHEVIHSSECKKFCCSCNLPLRKAFQKEQRWNVKRMSWILHLSWFRDSERTLSELDKICSLPWEVEPEKGEKDVISVFCMCLFCWIVLCSFHYHRTWTISCPFQGLPFHQSQPHRKDAFLCHFALWVGYWPPKVKVLILRSRHNSFSTSEEIALFEKWIAEKEAKERNYIDHLTFGRMSARIYAELRGARIHTELCGGRIHTELCRGRIHTELRGERIHTELCGGRIHTELCRVRIHTVMWWPAGKGNLRPSPADNPTHFCIFL